MGYLINAKKSVRYQDGLNVRKIYTIKSPLALAHLPYKTRVPLNYSIGKCQQSMNLLTVRLVDFCTCPADCYAFFHFYIRDMLQYFSN
jgi:hypothetical protein